MHYRVGMSHLESEEGTVPPMQCKRTILPLQYDESEPTKAMMTDILGEFNDEIEKKLIKLIAEYELPSAALR